MSCVCRSCTQLHRHEARNLEWNHLDRWNAGREDASNDLDACLVEIDDYVVGRMDLIAGSVELGLELVSHFDET